MSIASQLNPAFAMISAEAVPVKVIQLPKEKPLLKKLPLNFLSMIPPIG
jgi:hypothetical protein